MNTTGRICQRNKLIGFDVPVAHVDLYQGVCAVGVEALEDLLTRDGFEVDVEFRETGKGAESVLGCLIYLKRRMV